MGLAVFGFVKKFERMDWLAISMIGFSLGMGSTITMIGERELVDLRAYLHSPQARDVHRSRLLLIFTIIFGVSGDFSISGWAEKISSL